MVPDLAEKPLVPGQVRFLVHGPNPNSDEVSGAVFAAKLAALVRALKAADRALNFKSVHDYTIARMHTSTPTVVLVEQILPKQTPLLAYRSGIWGFQDCTSAILLGDQSRALKYGDCSSHIFRLGRGAKKQFGYAEVWTGNDNVVRVDPFLVERARAVTALTAPDALPQLSGRTWFKGAAHGTFQGVVKAVDLRGARPEIKLVLSAGGKELDCVFRPEHLDGVKHSLERLVRVRGLAHYDGRSGLPRRIDIADIEPVRPARDFTHWRGAYEPFEPDLWEGEGDDA